MIICWDIFYNLFFLFFTIIINRMSGGISFSKDHYWGKAGWAYRAVLDGICDALLNTSEGKELFDELSDEYSAARAMEYIDVQEWPLEKQKIFLEAIEKTYSRYKQNGPELIDPAFFPRFLEALGELNEMAKESIK